MTTEAERDCKHGQLARSCPVCELEAEIERKDAMLRQALGALMEADFLVTLPNVATSIAAIKQHLGEV